MTEHCSVTTWKQVARLNTVALLPGNTPIVTSGSLSHATISGITNRLLVKGHNIMEEVNSAFPLSGTKFCVFYKPEASSS